ncbi:MAG TPA: sugar ABC transporter ATP-binding protein [Candidatus Hydrogenedentes bacterium]|nr:sugar ABC transporter ATP-binding protein [Candidatus Hydrogenedentota bacterium]HOH43242.1 sugar ABC transporter ATP-binding protein [Candidatus Hydrogenedentota bacterium]HOR49985.1 sugar ABC transporter ATP-binding protein [Candidatus Hydrogenedentota bacterium]HPK23637.1 sugar ABC transporter ATP-binding protein [Candidatus Hydrogenedentota bacterium]HPX85288.1 sugar ABC transporter ATP-binding protein [Candidatus Hydrogenedentota bacterium]
MVEPTMAEYVLEMLDITKRYPGVMALNKAQLQLRPGEVHCLVGENGAGKSTLMKVLAGAIARDEGSIRIDGCEYDYHTPLQAAKLGISMIHQEFNLAPQLSVAENIYLGRAPSSRGIIRWRQMYDMARDALAMLDSDLDPRRLVATLSVAQQQMVEIAKALSINARILVMDEPSATLTDHELASLFHIMKILHRQGMGIIYISHRLEEIFAVGNRVTVMRDGCWIGTHDLCDVTREELIRMMVGRELQDEFPHRNAEIGEVRLEVQSLARQGSFYPLSFSVRAGEVVGLTGLVGSGRTEIARAIFGADPPTSGAVLVDGCDATSRTPRQAIRNGIGLLTEDRKGQGLVLGMSIKNNISLANMKAVQKGVFLSPSLEKAVAESYVAELQIKTPHVEEIAHHLSGGTQQKVVLAKWLLTDSKVLIFDEPTRGVDVGAKVEIYRLINTIASQGVAVLIITSELPEALGMCDRLLVMREGHLMGSLSIEEADQEKIMELATGDIRKAVPV